MKHPSRVKSLKRLEFAVQFATMDLEALRPGDWLNLREELMDFLGMTPKGFASTETARIEGRITHPPFPDQFPDWAFRQLQTETRSILQALVDDRQGLAGADHPGSTAFAVEGLIHSTGPHAPQPGYNVGAILGTTRDVFLYVLFHLLLHERTNMILRCPDCGTLFYRSRNQAYCSRSCVNRVSQRRWRERQDAIAAE